MDIEVEYLDLNICIVCLAEKPDMAAVEFTETDTETDCPNGPVLVKHFWFQEDELQFKSVCLECWSVVKQFHEFYLSVEKIHAEVTRISMAAEDCAIKAETDNAEQQEQEPCNQEIGTQEQEQLLEQLVEDDEETIAVEVEHWEQDSLQSESEESSDDEFEEDDLPEKQSNVKVKGRPQNSLTDVEKLEKLYHRSITEIEEEEEMIRGHCKMLCETCSTSFSSFADLKSHFREVHGIKGYLICCNKTFRKRLRLVEHVKKVNNPEEFHCTICNKSYSNSNGLSLHMATFHATPDELLFKCEQCDKSFAKKFQLTAHQIQHVPEEDKNIVCPKCNKAFATQPKLNIHMKLRHQPPKVHVCELCSKSFKSKVQFTRHCKEHEESHQEVRLQCKVCSKWLKNASSLRKHLQRHDGEGQTHECGICGKQAPNMLALQSHISFVHRKEKLFQCNLCPKSFKRQFSLAEHIATHTGEVLYHCLYCSKTFNSSANMHAHKKKYHPLQWEESRRKSELVLTGQIKVDVNDS